MATYTGVANANGDFVVPFSSNYTGGQKITVTAEKDGATKSIEIHAPSDVIGGSFIWFTGSLVNFPNNIGGVIVDGMTAIGNSALMASAGSFGTKATSLTIGDSVTSIGQNGFYNWSSVLFVSIGSGVTSLGASSFSNLSSCDVFTCHAVVPPTFGSSALGALKSTCIIKVPADSVAAYKAAAGWSAFASKIQAI